MTRQKKITIVGAGLAGSEAAWQAANQGCQVDLYEMRPLQKTDVHHTDHGAELVCSNSFLADDALNNAVGLVHAEMRALDSLIMQCADAHQVPAGGALAVDRDNFSKMVTEKLESHENIQLHREEITTIPEEENGPVILATGPLTSKNLTEEILQLTGQDSLAFFDAIAPIVYFDSIDMDICWFQSRYDKPGPGGTGADYINCPLNKEQYESLIDLLIDGDKTDFKEFEKNTPYFDACLPIEVMADRGRETLRFGPMKPVGLTNPNDPDGDLYAVVQLRQDNALGTLYNMVGFQTKLKYGAQKEVFKTIPGLQEAEFARLGGMHRNTYINSPELLDDYLRVKSAPHIRFAGQITGVEGYVESAALGLVCGRLAADEVLERNLKLPCKTTAHGSLVNHITGGHLSDPTNGIKTFQPMNINFGLMPSIDVPREVDGKRLRGKEKGRVKKTLQAKRALENIVAFKTNT